jgi:uncharacterized protein DUF4235
MERPQLRTSANGRIENNRIGSKTPMKILYKPFAIIASVIGAKLGHTIFTRLWSRIDDADPPGPREPNVSLPKVVGAKALEAATMAGVGAAVDRASAKWFHYLTGIWPGEKKS